MPDQPVDGIRPYLQQHAPNLATVVNNLWLRSRDLHDHQNRPKDSNENGRLHVEVVERNIWRLLTEGHHGPGPLIEGSVPKPEELFLLSCAACCHDFDKALPELPAGFVHGEGSGGLVIANAQQLGLDRHQAEAIAQVVSLHHLKRAEFGQKLVTLTESELTPTGPVNLRRVAVVLKAADILHCDHSRIRAFGADPATYKNLERTKYLAREATNGWAAQGPRVLIQASPLDDEARTAFSSSFQFMKSQEWRAVEEALQTWGVPCRMALHPETALSLNLPDETATEHADSQRPATAPLDLLRGYPEPQPKWVGRNTELAELHTAWAAPGTRVYAVIGFGGEGKTALVHRFAEFLRRQTDMNRRPVVVWWSFYFHRAADEFFAVTLAHFGIPVEATAELRARKLCDLLRTGVAGRRLLLVLDGLETLQDQTLGREGRLDDTGLRTLLTATLDDERPDSCASGTIIITTREPLRDLHREDDARYGALPLEELSVDDGVALLTQQYGLHIVPKEARSFVEEVGGHALTLTLIGGLLQESGRADIELRDLRETIASTEATITDPNLTSRKQRFHRLPGYVLRHCSKHLKPDDRQFLRLLSCCVRAANREDIEEVFLHPLAAQGDAKAFNDNLAGRKYGDVSAGVIARVRRLRLIGGTEVDGYDMHPLVRRHFYEDEGPPRGLTDAQRKAVHSRFYDVLPKRQAKRYPDTLEEMRPLIDAVRHGCRADRAQAAYSEVLYPRISRVDQDTSYLITSLGAGETEVELLRGFFPGGDFAAEPRVTRKESQGWLTNEAALALLVGGRPATAIPLFERALTVAQGLSRWDNASMSCQNLCESYLSLGRLPDAARAADDALGFVGRLVDHDSTKANFTEFSEVYAARCAALRGDDAAAAKHFAAALATIAGNWLLALRGGWHCAWLARRADFDRARNAAQENARLCAGRADLHEQTFVLVMLASVERLAAAATAPGRRAPDWTLQCAREAVAVGRRCGHHLYLTYALLEAGRCATASGEYDPANRERFVDEAERYFKEAEQRADYGGYRLILADLHVARAHLAWLAGDQEKLRRHCQQAIAICNEPDCGYAWARQDAEALLAR